MLEKLNNPNYVTISKPCLDVIKAIKEKKKKLKHITVAEIGVGIGATSNEIVKLLNEEDKYYMFSFKSDVTELETDLKKQDYCKTNIYAHGNTNRTYDSYAWSLAKLYNNEDKVLFDVVYLDGAHSFFHDGLTCCLLKKMIKKGGILVLDDIDWSHAKSPTQNPQKNPKVQEWFTNEQLETCQVGLVEEIFLKDDKNWKFDKKFSSRHRSAYKRIR